MGFLFTKKRLRELFDELREKTSGFTDFSAKTFSENSRYFAVVRIALGFSTDAFADICKRTRGSIYNLERSERRIPESLCSEYLDELSSLLSKMPASFTTVEKNYVKLYGRAKQGVLVLPKEMQVAFAKKGSVAALQKRKRKESLYYKATLAGIKRQQLTPQEKKVISLLKENEIPFETHSFIEGENADILIPGEEPIVVGCKSATNPRNLTDHARRLMYQAYRIKYKTKVKYVAVLGNSDGNLERQHIPLGALNLLKEICDGYFFDDNLGELIFFIQKLLATAPNGSPNR